MRKKEKKQPRGKDEFAVVNMTASFSPSQQGASFQGPARPRCVERKPTPGQSDIGLGT